MVEIRKKFNFMILLKRTKFISFPGFLFHYQKLPKQTKAIYLYEINFKTESLISYLKIIFYLYLSNSFPSQIQSATANAILPPAKKGRKTTTTTTKCQGY